MLEILVSGLFGYLMGSISVLYFWGKLKGIDLTKEGTEKLGASNAGRILGWHVMIIGGTADVFKGTVTLLILWLLFGLLYPSPFFPFVIFVASLSILLGHIISFWVYLIEREFHGGVGMAPFGGILLFISWPSFIFIFIVIEGFLQLTKFLIMRKLLGEESSIFENWFLNAVMVISAPSIVFLFSTLLLNIYYGFFSLLLVLTLELIMILRDWKKISSLLKALLGRLRNFFFSQKEFHSSIIREV